MNQIARITDATAGATVRLLAVGEGGTSSLGRVLAAGADTLVVVACMRGELEVAMAADAPVAVRPGDVLVLLAGECAPEVRAAQTPVVGTAALVVPGGDDILAARLHARARTCAPYVISAPSRSSRALLDAGASLRRATSGLAPGTLSILTAEVESALTLDLADSDGPRSQRRRSHRRIALLAREAMRQHVSDPLTITALAQRCQTSPTVLKESFKDEFGLPVHEWYRRYRMMRAAELLASGDRSVAEVAAAVGYANASKFAQAFGACMGESPSAWRRGCTKSWPASELTAARPNGASAHLAHVSGDNCFVKSSP